MSKENEIRPEDKVEEVKINEDEIANNILSKIQNKLKVANKRKYTGENEDSPVDDRIELNKALSKVGRKEIKELTVVKKLATNIEGTDNLGGYLVPKEQGEFLFPINDNGLVRGNATIIPMSRDKMDMPYPSTDVTAYNVNEAATGTVSNYVFGNLQLDTQKYLALVPMSSELIEDAYWPIDGILGNSFNIQFSGAEDSLFNTRLNSIASTYGTTGSVTGSFVNTVTTASAFTANVWSKLQGGLAGVNVGYEEGAAVIMHPTTWYTILSWSDTTARPIANLIDPINKMLGGHKVLLSNKMTTATDTTSGKVIIAYGNMKNAFLGDRISLQIDLFNQGTFGTTNAMESDLVVFRGRSRFDVELRPDAFWVYRLK